MTEPFTYDETRTLHRLANGEEQALKALLDQYEPILSPFIYNFTKSVERTEELIQDIFMQVWMARDTMTEINNLKGFLFVLAKNHALNAVRSMLREQKRLQTYGAMMATATGEEDADSRLEWIEEAISQLPAQQKKVWVLSRREGKKYAEIASELNISRETVKSYLQLANSSILRYMNQKISAILAGLLLFDDFLK